MKDYYGEHIQAIDAMQDWLSEEEFKGFLKGNVIKYLVRAGKKENVTEFEDIDKAYDYFARLYNELFIEENEHILMQDEELDFA